MMEPSLVAAEVRRILVVRLGAIGDMVVTLPALAALRRMLPAAEITFVANPGPASLVLGRGVIDRFTPYDLAVVGGLDATERPHPSPLPEGEGVGRSSALERSTFDLAVLWVADPAATLVGELATVGYRHFVACDPLAQTVGVPRHVADRLLQSVAALVPEPIAPASVPIAPRFVPTPEERAEANRLLVELCPGAAGMAESRRVVVHPGSGSPKKNWPAERYAAVVDDLLRRGETVGLVAGPADREVVRQVEQRLWRWRHSAELVRIPEVPLPILAALLERADAFLGNDSGITHLAAAVGAPTVAIFITTDPEIWGPRGPWVHILPDPPARSEPAGGWPPALANASPPSGVRSAEPSSGHQVAVGVVLAALNKAFKVPVRR